MTAALLIAGAAAMPSGAERGAPRGVADITTAVLKDYLTFISADEMEGRDTPSRGLDITARFLAVQLARAGAEPAGDNGTYFQRIGLTTRKVDPDKTTAALTAKSDKKPRRFTYGHDFLAAPVSGVAEGSLLYVGHGYVVKEKNLDAYKGLDVKGKILVSHSGYPPGVSRNDVRGPSGERWESAVTYAAKNGAKGVIYIPSFDTLARWDRSRGAASEEGTTRMDSNASTRPKEPEVPSITASPEMLAALFEDEKFSARDIFRRAQTNEPADGFALSASKQVRFSVETSATAVSTQNVVAIVRGSDPKLKDEYVALGAHYDHVGVAGRGRSAEAGGAGDSKADVIYNGADDDGSGTTALLVMAETAARLKPRPKRSLLFVWHAGEEHGLWGSAYYAQHPTVPLDRVVAQLNVDMIGRSRGADDKNPENKLLTGPNEVYVIGSKMMSSSLAELSERVNNQYLKVSFNYHYDDPDDPTRLFFRSDHYNYAKKGIPIIFYFSGLHEDYHQPSDSIEKIDFTKMERVTRTIYATALALADAPSRPKVDRELPRQLTEP